MTVAQILLGARLRLRLGSVIVIVEPLGQGLSVRNGSHVAASVTVMVWCLPNASNGLVEALLKDKQYRVPQRMPFLVTEPCGPSPNGFRPSSTI